jgi:D-3-phosphoglycerate dehydrogenase
MSNWKIMIAERLDSKGLEILSRSAEVKEFPGISAEKLIEEIGDYDALIVRGQTQVDAVVFSAAHNLKVIGRAGVGVDNIDLAAANQNNVTVVNSPSATTRAVAEHALALLLSLSRSISAADGAMKSGLWQKKQFIGVEIKDKVLGIVGMGHIGSDVAKMANSLGMQIIGYDPYLANEEIEHRGAKAVKLQELFSQSDFISIHVPLSPETRGMINGESFGTMKRGVRLIYTARGGIVDETALLAALESGQVAGAALDVFVKEPPGMSALVSHPKVIATPHIGAQTEEAQQRAAVDIAQEVLAALEGEPLRWKIV